MKTKAVSLYVDGAARGNPGPAGAGIVVLDEDGKKIRELYKYLGETTNNIAEYHALLYGLQEALILRADSVVVHLDSELISRQLKGEYRVKNEELKRLFEQALNMLSGFKQYTIKHIDREKNKEADRLANKAINLSALA